MGVSDSSNPFAENGLGEWASQTFSSWGFETICSFPLPSLGGSLTGKAHTYPHPPHDHPGPWIFGIPPTLPMGRGKSGFGDKNR